MPSVIAVLSSPAPHHSEGLAIAVVIGFTIVAAGIFASFYLDGSKR